MSGRRRRSFERATNAVRDLERARCESLDVARALGSRYAHEQSVAIPNFTSAGLLPTGIHLENAAVRERFAIDLFIDPDLDGMATFFQRLKIEDALQRGVPPRQLRGIVQVAL